jgi:hypothetical protein
MVQFFLNKGLVGVGLVGRFDLAWMAVTAIAVALQAVTIWLVFRLNAKHFRPERGEAVAAPAQ